MAKIDKRGSCYNCPYWQQFRNFCSYYNIFMVGIGYEATCNNPERIYDEE